MSNDPSYCAARATEERRLAMASENPNVRRIHLEMASKYAALAGTSATAIDETSAETEQQTA